MDDPSPIEKQTMESLESSSPPIQNIVIAIHGVGSQRHSETIRAVARRFGDHGEPSLPVMPLGFFYIGETAKVHWSCLEAPADDPRSEVGFAEVFWADIPRRLVKEDDTIEEIKAWGETVVSRARATYRQRVPNGRLEAEDFTLAAGVVDEIVETVAVMENLLVVAEKAGLFKFELAALLRDYAGDVQVVTEFEPFRDEIMLRFHQVVAKIVDAFDQGGPKPDIYIVAHSEGTVVSFLGLLQALSCPTVGDPDAEGGKRSTDWIRSVRGFMTIGSPIDKHLALWPKLWEGLAIGGPQANPGIARARLTLDRPIQWRNYYDLGDPIGFKLDTARDFLKMSGCDAFEFEDCHDHGFTRYMLPGKAHNDYWGDKQVFGHFIDDVVLGVPAEKPKDRWWTRFISAPIPYALSLALHWIAVFILFKVVAAPSNAIDEFRGAGQVALLALLLFGVTVSARIPRLVRPDGVRWQIVAALLFGLLATPTFLWISPLWAGSLALLGSAVPDARTLLLATAALVAASGWFVGRKQRRGRRTLVAVGAVIVMGMVLSALTGESTASALQVLLAGAAFVYLWWLGILLFDLAFVWHRYVRHSVGVQTLNAWWHFADPAQKFSIGKRAPEPRRSAAAGIEQRAGQ